MADALRLPRLERKPKTVFRVASWQDRDRVLADPECAKRITHIVRCIENGTPLPDGYYRKGVDAGGDQLLETEGFMHLHLGKSNTSELLWLMQFDDYVVLLEVSNHVHFTTRPPGVRLTSTHAAAVGALRRRPRQTKDKEVRKITLRPRKSDHPRGS